MLEKNSNADSDEYATTCELRIAAEENAQFFAEEKSRQADKECNKSNYYRGQQSLSSDYGEAHSNGKSVYTRRYRE